MERIPPLKTEWLFRSAPDNINPFQGRSECDKSHASANLKGIGIGQPPEREPGQKAVRCSVMHDKKKMEEMKNGTMFRFFVNA